ncbi:MAG: zinc dependent phospholipase C family protein [Roseburia sp.]
MPGFATHYLFGLSTSQKILPGRLTNQIKQHPNAFTIGLQGPDLFFYYLPCYLNRNGNIGVIAHEQSTGTLLQYLLKSYALFSKEKDKSIAAAYIAGFLGHYILDTTCHPYIYAKSRYGDKKNYTSRHMYLETDIDAEMLSYYRGIRPSRFHQNRVVLLTHREQAVISRILNYAFRQTYREYHFSPGFMRRALRSFYVNLLLLYDRDGSKKIALRKLEEMLFHHACISTLIGNDVLTFTKDPLNLRHRQWHNPWDTDHSSKQSFFDLYDIAYKKYKAVLNETEKLFSLSVGTAHYQSLLQALSDMLGNKSYHSGLPV